MVDDIRTLEALPRLLIQVLAVAMVILTLPNEARVAPFLPFFLERALLLVAGVWFVNLVNFMDGIDWITVAEVVPVTAALVVLGFNGGLPSYAIVVAIALCGAMLGFAYFNKPVARLFLGDVGSLPIGLLLGWLLLLLAAQGYVAAALLLPLYYLCRRHRHLVSPAARRRKSLGGASEPLLPARDRRRLQRARDRRAGLRAEYRAGVARGGDGARPLAVDDRRRAGDRNAAGGGAAVAVCEGKYVDDAPFPRSFPRKRESRYYEQFLDPRLRGDERKLNCCSRR